MVEYMLAVAPWQGTWLYVNKNYYHQQGKFRRNIRYDINYRCWNDANLSRKSGTPLASGVRFRTNKNGGILRNWRHESPEAGWFPGLRQEFFKRHIWEKMMSYHVGSDDIELAVNNKHRFSNDGWVTAPAERGKGMSLERGCVTAIKALTGAPATSNWRRGKKVKNNSIEVGTAVATFPVKQSGVLRFKGHAAIFGGYTGSGILLYDQWWSEEPGKRKKFGLRDVRYVGGGYISNDAEAFFVIELIEEPSSESVLPGPNSTY